MHQTRENGKKKLILGLIWVRFGPNLVPKKFFCRFYLYQISNIVASYHCMQFQGKLMNQTWEQGKKNLVSGPILDPLAQIWALKIFFVDFISTRC